MKAAAPAFTRFLFWLLVTLALAMLAVAGVGAWRELVVILFVYLLALLWRDFRFGNDHLFVDELRHRSRFERKQIFLFGHVIADEKAERDEERDLALLVGTGRYVQSLVVYAVLIVLLGYVFMSSGREIPQGAWLIVLMGLPLALASHSSHLLLSLYASPLVVLYAAWLGACQAWNVVTFSVPFFLALYAYRQAVADGARRTHKGDVSEGRSLSTKDVLRLAFLFLVFLAFFELIWPEVEPEPQGTRAPLSVTHTPSSKDNTLPRRLAQRAAEEYTKFESARRPGLGANPPGGEGDLGGFGSLQPPKGSGTSNESSGHAGLGAMARAPQVGSEGIPDDLRADPKALEELAKLSDELKQAAEADPEAFEKSGLAKDVANFDDALKSGRLGPEDFEKERRRLAAKLGAVDFGKQGTGSRPGAGKSGDGREGGRGFKPVQGAGFGAEANSVAATNSASSAARNIGEGATAGKTVKLPSEEPSSPAAKLDPPSPRDPEKAKQLDEAKKKLIEKRATKLVAIIEGVWIGGVALFVLVFLWRLTAKPSQAKAKRVRLTKEERASLQALLSQVRRRKLAPAEEVIETYHALLEVFAVMRYPRTEDLPPRDFSTQVASSLPSVAEPLGTATECFERTLYGELKIEDDRLAKFRKAVRSVLWYFNL